jgi:hypothetical protein
MGLASIIALEPDAIICAEASTGEQAQTLSGPIARTCADGPAAAGMSGTIRAIAGFPTPGS